MIQTDPSLRELLPTMQPTNGCSGIHYFSTADFDATGTSRTRGLSGTVGRRTA